VRGYALTPGLHKIEREGYFEPDGFYKTGDVGLVEGKRNPLRRPRPAT